MFRRAPLYFPLLLLALLAALTFWLEQKVQTPIGARDKKLRHEPDYIVHNFSAVETSPAGVPSQSLDAVTLTHFSDDDTSHLISPEFVRYSEKRLPVRITADTARVTAQGEHAHFFGNVRAVVEGKKPQENITILTDYLHVIADENLAKTDRPVTIQKADSVTTAVGMELNGETRELKLLSRVKVRYESPNSNTG